MRGERKRGSMEDKQKGKRETECGSEVLKE